MKKIIVFIVSLLLVISSCDNEDEFIKKYPQKEGFYLEIISEDAAEKTVTRSNNIAKNNKEKKINNLYLFFFDKNGNLLIPLDLDKYKSYIYREFYDYDNNSTALIVIPKNMFNDHEKAKTAKVYVVANIEKNSFDPEAITNEECLLNYNYCPKGEAKRNLQSLPEDGMPMFGQCVTPAGNPLLNLTLDNKYSYEENQATATLRAMMARIDFKITIDSKETDATKQLPTLDLTEWGIRNVPSGVKFQVDDNNATKTTSAGIEFRDVIYELPETDLIKNGDSRKVSLYIFENLQNPKSVHYPVGIKPEQQQKYKPWFADEYASVFVFRGKYTSYNKLENIARFKFYLGANNYDDFKVGRNCHYKNNIAIHGILANDKTIDETNVTYDARVDINDDQNRFFIKMLRERDHDAHYCVTPMDFYFQKNAEINPKIKVEIPEDCNWIRLEKIPAENMQNHDLPAGLDSESHIIQEHPFSEGHGKRKFFTTDLLTDVNQLANATSCEVNANRDRVYLYVDENISRYDRNSYLTVTYTDSELNEPIVRQIEIGQRGLLEVRQMEDGDDQYGNLSGKYFYIESTEEYLNAYDPLGKYNSSALYEGLPYGYTGENIAELTSNGKIKEPHYSINGYNMGLRISHRIYNEIAGKPAITLNEKPQNAVLYCYAKNKCDKDGVIRGIDPKKTEIYTGWALPGSRQLERAMMAYYNLFTDFQGNYYWSATPGDRKDPNPFDDDEIEETTKSRATKYVGIGAHYASKLGYLESDYKHPYEAYTYEDFYGHKYDYEGGGGWASRTKVFRVRAIYYYRGGERLPFVVQ